ncbi:carbohydrate porin [Pseudomonadota bacterium]
MGGRSKYTLVFLQSMVHGCQRQPIWIAPMNRQNQSRYLLVLLLAALLMPLAVVETSAATESAESSANPDLRTRSALTGDWWGARTWLADHGLNLDLRHTSFYQGLASGTGDKDFEYGGKLDAFINLDSGKMGLWEGGGFRSHLEYRHGDAPANLGGAIFAANTALYWPVDTPEKLVATSLYFNQKVGDRSSIALGKFNPVDLLAADPFYGGWGIDRFMSLVLAAPPSGLVPVVFMGAVANIQTKPASWTIMVFDPNDRTNDYFSGDLFEDGVNISVGGAHLTTLSGRKTTYAATAIYSTADGADYSSIGSGVVGTSTKSGSYNISFEFKHNLQESSHDPNAAWGFYVKAAFADGNPNYVRRSLIVGIGGRALFFGRPQDSFGVGAYLYDLSDTLQDSLDPTRTNFHNEGGLEVFYSFWVTPWLQIGADIQYINPARGDYKNALIPSLRTQIRF